MPRRSTVVVLLGTLAALGLAACYVPVALQDAEGSPSPWHWPRQVGWAWVWETRRFGDTTAVDLPELPAAAAPTPNSQWTVNGAIFTSTLELDGTENETVLEIRPQADGTMDVVLLQPRIWWLGLLFEIAAILVLAVFVWFVWRLRDRRRHADVTT